MLKIFLLIGALVVLTLYFIPTLIAWRRKHHGLGIIVCINLLLGWTFLGWIAALIWSLSYSHRRARA